MKSKNRISFVIITISLLFTLLFSIVPVNGAFDYAYFTISETYGLDNVPNQILYHSSGVLIYVHNTIDEVNMRIYNQEGELIANQDYTYGKTGKSIEKARVKVVELDSDEILIATHFPTSQTSGNHLQVFRVNINTYNLIAYPIVSATTAAYDQNTYLSYMDAVKHDNNWYFFIASHVVPSSSSHQLHVCKYNVATNGLTKHITVDLDADVGIYTPNTYGSRIGVVQDEDNTEKCYAVLNKALSTDNPPFYYRFDLDAQTNELLCTHPVGERYTDDRRQLFLGGGIEYNNSDPYLYFIYVTPLNPSMVVTLTVVQQVMKFNGTISTANLLQQDERVVNINPNVGSTTTPVWSLGQIIDYDEFIIWYPSEDSGNNIVKKMEITVDDFFDMSIAGLSIDSNSEDLTVPNNSEHEIVGRDNTSPFQVNEFSNIIYIYYDLSLLYYDYDISMSYIPNDDPILINTNYRFTIHVDVNNASAYKKTISLYKSGSLILTSVTDAYGDLEFLLIHSVMGILTFKVEVYDGSPKIMVYDEEFDYIFADYSPEGPETSVVLPTSIGLFFGYLPVMAIYSILVTGFTEVAGTGGFILGIVLSTIVCVMAGLLPMYIAYLMILVVIMAVAYLLKSGGG